jgi:hypothetical protein
MPETINDNWLEGFVGQAKEAGLDEEQAAELLKASAQIQLMEKDSAFAAGYNQEMQKQGQGAWKALSTLLSKPAISMPLTAGGLLGGQNIYDWLKRNWRKGPQERMFDARKDEITDPLQFHKLQRGDLEVQQRSVQDALGNKDRGRKSTNYGDYYNPHY